MTGRYELLIRGARVVDPVNGLDAVRDVAIDGPYIVDVTAEIDPSSASRVVDRSGYALLPGIIDTHVHLFNRTASSSHGHRALARAGVTTAVEFSNMRGVLGQWTSSACGLTVLGIEALPAYQDSGTVGQIRDEIAAAVRDGCIGVKIFGGHFPSTPEASAKIIAEANAQGVYVAFHAGTTAHGSDLEGMREALALADGNALHLAHTSAYLRGMIADPVDENTEVLRLLREHPRVVSEAHLGPLNGCGGRLENGAPADHIARNCLRMRGYSVAEAGLRQAFLDGYAHVNEYVGDDMVQYTGAAALEVWVSRPATTRLSFPVNLRLAAYLQTCARLTDSGQVVFEGPGAFIVDAISSDGGNWRNVILTHGLDMVHFGALTLSQFVHKSSARPAQMIGLGSKGHLTPGADADLVLVDLQRRQVRLTVAGGQVIYDGNRVVGTGGTVVTTHEGAASLRARPTPPCGGSGRQPALHQRSPGARRQRQPSVTVSEASSRLSLLEISGPPLERGRQHGEAARDQIRRSIAYYQDAYLAPAGLAWAQALDLSQRWIPLINDYLPDILDEVRGIAEGAGLRFEEILWLNNRADLIGNAFNEPPPEDACTAFAITAEAAGNGHVYCGQNWDWRAEVQSTVLLLRIVQPPKPTIVLQVEAGQIGRQGANSAGIALNANGLGERTARWRTAAACPRHIFVGVFSTRRMCTRRSPRPLRRSRPSAAILLIAHREGVVIDLETTPGRHLWMYPSDGVLVHTNHFVGDVPPQIQASYRPSSVDSLYRLHACGRCWSRSGCRLMRAHYAMRSAQACAIISVTHTRSATMPTSGCHRATAIRQLPPAWWTSPPASTPSRSVGRA